MYITVSKPSDSEIFPLLPKQFCETISSDFKIQLLYDVRTKKNRQNFDFCSQLVKINNVDSHFRFNFSMQK